LSRNTEENFFSFFVGFSMLVLMLGDIYGQPGRKLVQKFLPKLREDLRPDWVIANGENASGGVGLSIKHRNLLFDSGIDAITNGNHLFARPYWPEIVSGGQAVLRPHNIGGDSHPGRGFWVLSRPGVPPLGLLNLAGRIFMEPAECPFKWADVLISRIGEGIPILLDFHAEATSEKIAMAWHLDGRIAFLAGTHTHVQTADERILPNGTGAITDIGMTGPREGVLGVKREIVLDLFRKGFSDRFSCAPGPGILEGVAIEISSDNKTESIKRIRVQE